MTLIENKNENSEELDKVYIRVIQNINFHFQMNCYCSTIQLEEKNIYNCALISIYRLGLLFLIFGFCANVLHQVQGLEKGME